MSDKILDLIEKMYIDLKTGQDKIAGDVSTLKEDFQKLSNQMVRFENGMKEDARALYDGYKLTYELAKENNEKLESLNNKIEKQEVEIKVIKGGKR